MTETIKLFGHEPEMITAFKGARRYRWSIGLFEFRIDVTKGPVATGDVKLEWKNSPYNSAPGTIEFVIDRLESSAREFMRECLEIAGPMEASSCELLEPADVRYCYE